MSRGAVRTGPAVIATTTTTGTPGTSDEVRSFVGKYARPCFVTNVDATDSLYVLPNAIDCSATNFLVKLAPGQAVDISVESQIDIQSVSLFFATAAYSKALVRGWLA